MNLVPILVDQHRKTLKILKGFFKNSRVLHILLKDSLNSFPETLETQNFLEDFWSVFMVSFLGPGYAGVFENSSRFYSNLEYF